MKTEQLSQERLTALLILIEEEIETQYGHTTSLALNNPDEVDYYIEELTEELEELLAEGVINEDFLDGDVFQKLSEI